MAKRLQVILQDPDYREIQRAARSQHMSIAEWVRKALASARRKDPSKSLEKKLQAIRTAVKYEFPAGDIDEMLKEIEEGYLGGEHP
jgi:hypothetical protein